MIFIDVPLEPIARNASPEERQMAWEAYREQLKVANPSAFDADGNPLTVAKRFLNSFWYARKTK